MRQTFLVLTILFGLIAPVDAGETAPHRYALLVGCTQYPYCKRIRELNGPRNDVPLMARVLTERFGFEDKNIVRLVGWPDEPAKQPTHDNIVSAFEDLVRKATPDTQIVILMSGHGTQVPIPEDQKNPLDPKNPESDGLDEVFLPADVKSWSTLGLGNALRDDQIGGWLNAMRDKGASVWILFDCCHSGTMTRGDELSRAAGPDELEIPAADLERAKKAARKAAEVNPTSVESKPVDLRATGQGKKGNITAFYAAQPFEEAPELPRPAGVAKVPENYYGLMTFVVAQALLAQPEDRPLSYRDLSQLVLGRYRAERGSRGPTPLFDINDNRPVLGITGKSWPQQKALTFEKHDDELRVIGGALRGMSPGCLLKLVGPASAEGVAKLLGYVRVKSATIATAVVEPCEYEGRPAVSLDDLPAIGRCEIVARDLGETRVKLRTRLSAEKSLEKQNELLSNCLSALSDEARDLITKPQTADEDAWVLWLASQKEAREFGFELADASVLLVHSDVFGTASPQSARSIKEAIRTKRPSARFAIEPAKVLAAQLENDLRRIFTWQCLWRFAAESAGSKSDRPAVTLEVAALKSAEDRTAGEVLRGSVLSPGQCLEVRVENPSDENQWVTVLFLGADYHIELFAADSVKSENKLTPFQVEIDDSSLGNEGLIVLSLPMSEYRQQPDFKFLEQTGLGSGSRALGANPAGLDTPFGRLMQTALRGKTTRGPSAAAPDNAHFTSWTWITAPRR